MDSSNTGDEVDSNATNTRQAISEALARSRLMTSVVGENKKSKASRSRSLVRATSPVIEINHSQPLKCTNSFDTHTIFPPALKTTTALPTEGAIQISRQNKRALEASRACKESSNAQVIKKRTPSAPTTKPTLDTLSNKSDQRSRDSSSRSDFITHYDAHSRFAGPSPSTSTKLQSNEKQVAKIIGDSNFEFTTEPSINGEFSTRILNSGRDLIDPTTGKESAKVEQSVMDATSKTKSKRCSSTISTSLRRLINLTFNRNPHRSATSKVGQPVQSHLDATSVGERSLSSYKESNNNIASSVSAKKGILSSPDLNTDLRERNRSPSSEDKKRKRHLTKPSQAHNFCNSSNGPSVAWLPASCDKRSIARRSSLASQPIEIESNPRRMDHKSKTSNANVSGPAASRSGNSSSSKNYQLSDSSAIDGFAEIDGKKIIECPLCVLLVVESSTPTLDNCRHRVCLDCMQRYLSTEINHSRLNITCPICSELLHPNTIKDILKNEKFYLKYENFMLRRVLAAEPDARWCPAPDCEYAVLANGCASCPKLVCRREGCNTAFCYHCKQEWHPNQTCSAASIQRTGRLASAYNITDLIEGSNQGHPNRKSSKSSQQGQNSFRAEDIKECPVCSCRIIKMNDGSCNHMTCSICETEFCWLCMKEISDLHYFSPSGCTFWGKKPWSRKKKLLWQLGMLVGAPICILMIAGIAVPAIVVGIPLWAARKLHNRLERKPFSRYKKNAIIVGGVLLSFVISPFVSIAALGIGIPVLLGYVYGVVPLSLCRTSGGCLSSSLEDLQQQFQSERGAGVQANDVTSIDTALSHKLGDPSIGETSLYMSNISLETNSIGHVTTVEREDRESASNAALAGSIISNVADDGNSTKALAGSIMSKESGYTLVPAEVHNSIQHSNPVFVDDGKQEQISPTTIKAVASR